MTPPRLPRWLLRLVTPAVDRATLIGDLDEEFRVRDASGRGATAWYWRQALASAPAALGWRVRRAAPLADLSLDVRVATRQLRRSPGFAAAAILTMTLGAGIMTGVTSIADAILVRPLPYANGDRVYAVQESDGTRHGTNLSWADFVETSTLHSFSAVAGFNGASRILTGAGAPERLQGATVTPAFFGVLGVRPAMGRDFMPQDAARGEARVVILSDSAWRRRFDADPSVVGRAITLSGEAYTVIGVLPANFVFPPRANPEVYMPQAPSPEQLDRPYLHFLDVVAVLAPGVTPAMAADELRTRSREWNTHGPAWHATTSLRAVSLRADMVAVVRPALLVLLGGSLLLLVAAAASVAGLVIVRASTRRRDAAVRAALGATRYRLARQPSIEALLLGIAGAAGGLVAGRWALTMFSAATPLRIRATLPYAQDLAISPRAAVVSALLTIGAVAVASLWPVFRLAPGVSLLAGGTRTIGTRADARVRAVLVATQIALAVVLLAGAVLVGRSVRNLSRVSPGFTIDGLVAGRVLLPPVRYGTAEAKVAAVERLLAAAQAIPGVTGAEAINQLPLGGGGNTGDFSIVGRAVTPPSNPLIRDVTPGYFSLLGLPLVEGRRLLASDTRSAPHVVVVNRTLARFYFGEGSALGQRIVFAFFTGRPEWTIVGVVGDEQFDALDKPMEPVVYFPFAQDPEGAFNIVARAAAPEAIMPSLRSAVASVDPELPLFGLSTLAQTAAESNAMFLRGIVTRLFAWFSVAALLLCGVGIYGILAQAIAARTREIGLRVALGATRTGIVSLVVRAAAVPAAGGLAAGAALCLLGAPAVRTLLFGIGMLDPLSLAIVVTVMAAVAALACAVPVRRVLQLSVATALRQD